MPEERKWGGESEPALFDEQGRRMLLRPQETMRWYIPSWDELDTLIIERFDADGRVIDRTEYMTQE